MRHEEAEAEIERLVAEVKRLREKIIAINAPIWEDIEEVPYEDCRAYATATYEGLINEVKAKCYEIFKAGANYAS